MVHSSPERWLIDMPSSGLSGHGVYLLLQSVPAVYTTVDSLVIGNGHKGLNSEICPRRRGLDHELLPVAAELLNAFHRLVA
jgi:hypothetical protein